MGVTNVNKMYMLLLGEVPPTFNALHPQDGMLQLDVTTRQTLAKIDLPEVHSDLPVLPHSKGHSSKQGGHRILIYISFKASIKCL